MRRPTTLRVTLPFLALALLASACATPQPASAPVATPRSRSAFAAPSPHAPDAPAHAPNRPEHRAYPVLVAGERVFVLTGPAAAPAPGDASEILPGGFVLDVRSERQRRGSSFTLVGPDVRCVGPSIAEVRLAVRAHASVASGGHAALEMTGCARVARGSGFVLALPGDQPSARWLTPGKAEESRVPGDRRLGESEVWLRRWAFDGAEAEVVEKSALYFVSRSCSEERRDVIVVDETARPLANHRGFALHGAVSTSRGVLLVLLGHDDPEALRVVTLDAPEQSLALDTRIALFPDVERAEC